jgi:hypothetical protein
MASVTLNCTADTFVRKSEPNTNKEGESYMVIGKTGSSNQIDRILLAFSFSAYLGKIVDSATLNLRQKYSSYRDTAQLHFYALCISSSWSAASVKWSNQPSFTTNGAVNLYLSGNANGDRTFDITGLLRDITQYKRTCYGILLKAYDESADNNSKQFETIEGDERPTIDLVYHDMNLYAAQGGTNKLLTDLWVAQGGTFKQTQPNTSIANGGGWDILK